MIRFGISKKAGTALLTFFFQRLITNCTHCIHHPQNCAASQKKNKNKLIVGGDKSLLSTPWGYDRALPGAPQLQVPVGRDAPVVTIVRNPLTRFLSAFLDKGVGIKNGKEKDDHPSCFGEAAALYERAGGVKGARTATGAQRLPYIHAFRHALQSLDNELQRLASVRHHESYHYIPSHPYR